MLILDSFEGHHSIQIKSKHVVSAMIFDIQAIQQTPYQSLYVSIAKKIKFKLRGMHNSRLRV